MAWFRQYRALKSWLSCYIYIVWAKHIAKSENPKERKQTKHDTTMSLWFSRGRVSWLSQGTRPVWWTLRPARRRWAVAPHSALRAQRRPGSCPKSCRSARPPCWSPPLTSLPWAFAAPPFPPPRSHQPCYRSVWSCPCWKLTSRHRVKTKMVAIRF